MRSPEKCGYSVGKLCPTAKLCMIAVFGPKSLYCALEICSLLPVELKEANQASAAGSLAAASRFRPTETVSRRSPSLISTTSPDLPGQTCVVLPSRSLGLPIVRQSFGAVDV